MGQRRLCFDDIRRKYLPSGVARRILGWSDIVPVCAIATERSKMLKKDESKKPGMNIYEDVGGPACRSPPCGRDPQMSPTLERGFDCPAPFG